MKKITIFFFVLFLGQTLSAQRIDWMDFASASLASVQNAVTSDGAGNIYSFHSISDNIVIQGDTISALYGQSDCILLKYDSVGNIIWSKVFGGNWFDNAYKVAVDGAGHVYVSAHIQNFTSMTDTVFTNSTNYLLLQFDSSGNFLRVKFIPGLGSPALAALGNYAYIAYGNTVEKLDTNLNTIWSRTATAGSLQFNPTGDLYITPGGRLIATGRESSGNTVTFDTISFSFSPGSFNEIFVISMDTSGTAFWGKALYGPSSPVESTYGAAGDDAGNVYVTLRTTAQMIFGNDTLENPTSNPNNNYCAILRYDNAGNEIWGRALYPIGSAEFYDIIVNNSSEILVAGYFLNGAASFGQFNFNPTGAAILIKIDMNGNAIWEKFDQNSSQTKHFREIVQLSPGKYAAVGFFNSNFQIDCFYGGFSNYGFFTTVVSENPVINAAFTFNAINPFMFNFMDQSVGAISWTWSFPGGTPATSALQNPTVTYPAPGSYTVSLVACDDICCDSVSFQILNVGIGELSSADLYLEIHPNPVSNELRIESQKMINEIIITDMLGKEILRRRNLDVFAFEYNASHLFSGIYLIHVVAEGVSLTRKVVKQ